jgi:NADPH:quinone reductase-like Zn-dependent oxidoreductase
MRAIVQDRYGAPSVLRLRDIDRPAVGADEVLVRVRAASVHPDVWHVVTGRPYALRLMGAGLRRPKPAVPGTDLAGVVEAVGDRVTRFRPGDEVFGETVRGHSWRHGGAFAEYAAVPESGLEPKPVTVSFEQAATVPTAGYIALLNVPFGQLRPGRRVLVNGAGGGVGGIVVQLAKSHGAHVTGVDIGRKHELLQALGADDTVDHTREDFTRRGERYDLLVDIPGNRSLADCRRVLAADGTYVLIGHNSYGRVGRGWLGSLPTFAKLGVLTPFVPQLRGAARLSKRDAMARLHAYLETGRLAPVIARTFPLDQAGEAIRHLAEDEALGRVVLTV